MNKQYKGVIFDLDGTLVNTERMNLIPLQRLIKEELGKDIAYGELLRYNGYPGKAILTSLGFSDVETSYAKWVRYLNRTDEKATLYEGWNETIPELSRRGYIGAIASSKMRRQYEIDFLPTGLEKHLQAIVLADDTTEHKPHPAPLLKAAKQISCAPDTLIYVGDTSFDREATERAGMDFALATWGASDLTLPAKYVLTKPEDLLDILK